MERDFMGLNSKEPLAVVKEEIDDGGKDSAAFAKGSGMQWPFLNDMSALPHFMTPKVAREDWAKKIVADPLAFDPRHKSSKTFNHDRQGSTHLLMTAHHPVQQDVHFVRRSHDAKMFLGSNQAVAVSLSHPFFNSHFATTDQHNNLAVGSMKEQSVGGIPHSVLPSVGSVAGIAEQWNQSKAGGAPPQLTIFYKGTVNIYNDISPEKAQAIMFLAGNGISTASTLGQSRGQAQPHTPKMAAAGDGHVLVNQPANTPPCSAISSPISVSSHPVPQSGSGSTSSDELVAAKHTGLSATPVKKLEPPYAVNSLGTVAAKTMMPSAVPLARKASLARFLEKRKERMMNTAPYNLGQKTEFSAPGPNGMGLSATYGAMSASRESGRDN